MAERTVLVSHERPDPTWRVEQRDGWCSVLFHGALVLDRASIDEVARHLEAAGVDIERDLTPG